MAESVWKFELPIDDVLTIDLPFGAKVLSVGQQSNKVMIWAQVNPQAPTLPSTFRIAGTGHRIANPERWEFRGTAFLHDGGIVLHVFQLIPRYEPLYAKAVKP